MQIVFLMSIMTCCYVLQSLFCKFYSDAYKGEKKYSSAVFSVMFGSIIGLCTWGVGGFQITASYYTWVLGLITAIMLFLFNTSLVNASQLGPYSMVMVANLFGGTVIPVLVAVLFFDEKLTTLQLVAIILMLFSIIIMNYNGMTFKSVPKKYYFWCGVLFFANGIFCSLMNAQQMLMEAREREQMITIAYVSCAIMAFTYHLIIRKKKILLDYRIGKKAMLFALVSCLVATLAVNLIMIVLSQLASSIVFTVTNGGVLTISILCAYVFLKERPTKSQVLGMGISVFGIILFSI